MRTIKELLQVMLDNQKYFTLGLCSWAKDLLYSKKLINIQEFYQLYNYVEKNRPSKFSSISAFKNRENDYYWEVKDINPRIKWLKKHIKKNS